VTFIIVADNKVYAIVLQLISLQFVMFIFLPCENLVPKCKQAYL